jgi:hypothetical protein
VQPVDLFSQRESARQADIDVKEFEEVKVFRPVDMYVSPSRKRANGLSRPRVTETCGPNKNEWILALWAQPDPHP